MRLLVITFTYALIASALACSTKSNNDKSLPHLPPLGVPFSLQDEVVENLVNSAETEKLKAIITVGKTSLEWVSLVNSSRHADKKIIVNTPENINVAPMDNPKVYNADIVIKTYQKTMDSLDNSVRQILLNGNVHVDLPVSDVSFAKQMHSVQKVYYLASRWLMLSPHLKQLSQKRALDVRGLYFLSQTENLEQKLANESSLADSEKTKINEWLVQVCTNNFRDESECENELQSAIRSGKRSDFFKTYQPGATELMQSFFNIRRARNDIKHFISNGMEVFQLPFATGDARLVTYVQKNVEDEWRSSGWGVKLAVVEDSSPQTTHIEFEPGTTPHVDGAGGSRVVLDSNMPIDDYLSGLIIRHEFGHVLGFPDCYLEFYDEKNEVMVNYQIDLSNLMCSGKGKILPLHYRELQQAYGR